MAIFGGQEVVLGVAKDLLGKNINGWHVYIIECKDGTLYTGITNNLERRIKQHNYGRGCKFTKYRSPVKLLYNEECLSKAIALRREARIKSLTRAKKLELIGVR